LNYVHSEEAVKIIHHLIMPLNLPQLAPELQILQDKKGTPYLRIKKADVCIVVGKLVAFGGWQFR
jgi:hypothetical protein